MAASFELEKEFTSDTNDQTWIVADPFTRAGIFSFGKRQASSTYLVFTVTPISGDGTCTVLTTTDPLNKVITNQASVVSMEWPYGPVTEQTQDVCLCPTAFKIVVVDGSLPTTFHVSVRGIA